MNFPPCPTCAKGQLVPLSVSDETYHCWVCTRPDCNYTIGPDHQYYKGGASLETTEDDDRTYTSFNF